MQREAPLCDPTHALWTLLVLHARKKTLGQVSRPLPETLSLGPQEHVVSQIFVVCTVPV